MRMNNKSKLVIISVNIEDSDLARLEHFVNAGKFPNRSEAIRIAIRDMVKSKYLKDKTLHKIFRSSIKDGRTGLET